VENVCFEAKSLKVLFVISGLSIGGAERQVVLLSRELARRGHLVCIYCLNELRDRVDEIENGNVCVVFDQKRLPLDFSVLHRLRRFIQGWRPDIVHGFLFDGNIYSRLSAVGLGIPVLDSERSDNYRLRAAHLVGYFLTSRLSCGVVANSRSGAQFATRQYMRPGKGVHVLWNGIDLLEVDRRLANARCAAGEVLPGSGIKRVVVVGTIKPAKDLLLAMRVARRLVDTDNRWRMLVVGGDSIGAGKEYKRQVIHAHDELQLQDIVRFAGSRRDVLEIMASCDVVLMTSRHEGFPNVVLEAMACSTPVASTDYSDVRRILPMDWQVVSSRDEGDLVQAILRCDRERPAVAAAQRRWVETHATAGICAERLLAIYESYTTMASAAAEQVG
jgi:glycosyltransferase involved in cell wall biosynthesis